MYKAIIDDFLEGDERLLAGLTLAQITRPTTPTSTANNGGPFNKDLSNAEFENLRKAQGLFNAYKKGPNVQSYMNASFDQAENPYELALKYHVQGVNYRDCKTKSFTFYVLEAFRNYIAQRPNRHSLLDEPLKMTTFNLTNKDPNGHLFRFAAEAYRFAESPDLFKDYVQNLIDHHKYAAAAQVAQWTGQSREEYLYGFLVPLAFSRNQANVLYDYLEAQPALLVDIVQLLDSLMSNAAQSCRQLMAKYNYRNIPQESLTEEYLRKNIPKIRKKFNLSTDATPNTAFQQNIKALTFWIRKFALGEAEPLVFEDNIKTLVSPSDLEAQNHLIITLLNFGIGLECSKWIHYFNIDIGGLPEHLRNKIKYAESNQRLMGRRLEPNNRRNVYTVDTDKIPLRFVNNATIFQEMLSILDGSPLLAFDVECKQSYVAGSEMAVLQLATETHIFVVDKMSTEIPKELWQRFGELFSRPQVMTMGFGCRDDLGRLFEECFVTMAACNRAIDFSRLWLLLEEDKYFQKALTPRHVSTGRKLKDLVKVFLQKNLDKGMQLSNWGLRPLRHEQILYAGLDAYCLLEVYREMERLLAMKNIDMEEVLSKYHQKNSYSIR